MKKLTTEILLEEVEFFGHHGITREERDKGNTFLVNISVKLKSEDFQKFESIEDSVDYVDLYNIIKEEMEVPTPLLEQIGSRILKRLSAYENKIEQAQLKIVKKNPPIGGNCEDSAVVMTADY